MTKLFVGGLPYHTTDLSLQEYFAKFGDIEEAVVIIDRQTDKSRGYGFVTMADEQAAARACEDPNPIIDGRKANVNLAYLGAKPRAQPTLELVATPQTTVGNIIGQRQAQQGMQHMQLLYPSAYMAAATSVHELQVAPPSPLSATTDSQFSQFNYASAATTLPHLTVGAQLPTSVYTAAAYNPYGAVGARQVVPATYSYTALQQLQNVNQSASGTYYQPERLRDGARSERDEL